MRLALACRKQDTAAPRRPRRLRDDVAVDDDDGAEGLLLLMTANTRKTRTGSTDKGDDGRASNRPPRMACGCGCMAGMSCWRGLGRAVVEVVDRPHQRPHGPAAGRFFRGLVRSTLTNAPISRAIDTHNSRSSRPLCLSTLRTSHRERSSKERPQGSHSVGGRTKGRGRQALCSSSSSSSSTSYHSQRGAERGAMAYVRDGTCVCTMWDLSLRVRAQPRAD